MKKIRLRVLIFVMSFTFLACQKQDSNTVVVTNGTALNLSNSSNPPAGSESGSTAIKAEDDFSDLKAKKEGCTSEEELKKKLEEEAKKKVFKLQGGKADCVVK